MNVKRRFCCWVLLLTLLVPVTPVVAQSPATLCSQEAGPAGCLDLTLSAATLLGDVYVDGALIAAQVNAIRLSVVPGVAHVIEVHNITDTTPGFGDIFVYGDVSRPNVLVGEGRVVPLALKPQLTYLKGFARFTCDIKARAVEHEVLCQPSVAEMPLPAVAAGESADFALPIGAHTLHVDLIGAHAGLWAPSAQDLPVTITGGGTTPVRGTFNRKGKLVLGLSVSNVVGDFYVDEQPIAAQVLTATVFVAPGNHKVEVRNVVDPAANGVYRYPDAAMTASAVTNQSRVVTLRLLKEYLLGFGQLTCKINGLEAGQDVRCQVLMDGADLGLLEAGQAQTHNLTPGPHTVTVSVVGSHADLWAPNVQSLALAITAGRNSPLTAKFDRKGQLTLSLNVPNVTGDFYVDDQPIAAQVPTAAIFVSPGNHKVEVRNVVDPAANGVYRYPDATVTASAVTNQTRAVALRLAKEYLLGFGQLTCKINGLEAGQDVRCHVLIDGADLGLLEAGQTQTYNLTPGPHAVNVSVIGGHADLWAPNAQDLALTITAGRNSLHTAKFDRKGQLTLSLNVPNVVGDFYVDDQPIAAQVPTAAIFVSPGNHKVEVRNVVDPIANGVYRYPDVAMTASAVTNQTRAVALRLAKEYLLGFGQFTCKINGLEAGQDVRCHVLVDGADLGLLEAGQTQTYNLTPGSHTVNVSVIGGHAALWAPNAQDLPLTITAGRNSALAAGFNRKGILKLTLSDPNVVADIFLDGNLVIGQVNATDIIVDPNVRHTVEARTLRNITAPDAFEYDNLSQVVTLSPNQTRGLTLAVGRPRERCTASMALVRVVSWLPSRLTLQMVGPETKTVYVPANNELRVCVLPGTYTITESAPGYYTEVDTQTLGGGSCSIWRFWDQDGAVPPDDGCSGNPADYSRP